MTSGEAENWLQQLELTAQERDALENLGAPSPAGLAHMIRGSREAFYRMFKDNDRARRIEADISHLLTPAEIASLEQPPPPPFSLGARLDDPQDG
jgi:hypothetical protein